MTARSEYGYFVRGTAERIASTAPVDAAVCRDGIVNNVNHLLDERGNVAVNASGFWESPESESVDTWHQLFALRPLAFPITILPTGRSALVVPHIRGSVESSGTATFRIRLSRWSGSASGPSVVVATNCSEVSTTSTTGADLTPDPIYLPAALVGDVRVAGLGGTGGAARPFPSLDGGDRAASVNIAMAQLEVWASFTASLARVHGIHAREYIGG